MKILVLFFLMTSVAWAQTVRERKVGGILQQVLELLAQDERETALPLEKGEVVEQREDCASKEGYHGYAVIKNHQVIRCISVREAIAHGVTQDGKVNNSDRGMAADKPNSSGIKSIKATKTSAQ